MVRFWRCNPVGRGGRSVCAAFCWGNTNYTLSSGSFSKTATSSKHQALTNGQKVYPSFPLSAYTKSPGPSYHGAFHLLIDVVELQCFRHTDLPLLASTGSWAPTPGWVCRHSAGWESEFKTGLNKHQRLHLTGPMDGARWQPRAKPGMSQSLLCLGTYSRPCRPQGVGPSWGWRTRPGVALTTGPGTGSGRSTGRHGNEQQNPGACPGPAPQPRPDPAPSARFPSLRSHRDAALDPRLPRPLKWIRPLPVDSNAERSILSVPRGERGPRPPRARGRRPPTSSSCSLAMAQVRAVGALGDAGGGAGTRGMGGRWGSFSRVRGPASRHRKLSMDHREGELARETRARPLRGGCLERQQLWRT